MQQGSRENAIRVLKYIQEHFDELDQHVKKAIYQEMLDRVELFKEPLPDGRWVKSVHFRFPVLIDGEVDKDWYATDLPDGWNLRTQDESVCLLSHQQKDFI
jgi:site-specific DNA recombinase